MLSSVFAMPSYAMMPLKSASFTGRELSEGVSAP